MAEWSGSRFMAWVRAWPLAQAESRWALAAPSKRASARLPTTFLAFPRSAATADAMFGPPQVDDEARCRGVHRERDHAVRHGHHAGDMHQLDA